jgi:hypothetical protein
MNCVEGVAEKTEVLESPERVPVAHSVRFPIPRRYQHRELAERMTALVVGTPMRCYEIAPGHWQLGDCNDWWLTFHKDGTTAELSNRYQRSPEAWASLQTVIEMLIF